MKKEQYIAIGIVGLFLAFLIYLLVSTPSKDLANNSKNTLTNSQQSNSSEQSVTNSTTEETMKQPKIEINKEKKYTAVMQTSEGTIKIELNAKETPITVNNFVVLSKRGYYNNTIFHRAIKDFMIQGGDPKGNGTGGPGYRFDDEKFEGEYTRGTIAMANAGPNTNGSQFFIMHKDYPLPKSYVIFGHVVEGLDVVDKIAEAEVEMSASGEQSKPVNPVKVEKVEIIEE